MENENLKKEETANSDLGAVMPRKLTKKQKAKADKILKLIEELNQENVTFMINSMPDLQIGFLRDAELVDGYDAFFGFINSKNGDRFYSPYKRLKLDCYGA